MTETESINIEYHTLRRSHELVVSEIAEDPKQIAAALFKHQFISQDTLDRVNELNETKRDKASRLVCEIETEVNHSPTSFQQILTIITETDPVRYKDLVTALQVEYNKLQATSQNEFLQRLIGLDDAQSAHQLLHVEEDIPVLPELPTADDRSTVPDPLENLPDSEEVGRDITTSLGILPSANLLEGKLLNILQNGECTEAIELLSRAETQDADMRSVRDSDGKTLLHLACQKNFLDWYPVVQSLIEKHNCDVSAVDEDGNTPLHEAYQCGNYEVVTLLLSKPDCDPDAFNKHEFNVLRMALQKNDIETTRALLATGRVDPRRGSPRGHTYNEVIEMDGTMPENINDSALQIVTKCAKCIQNNSFVYPNFAMCYLLDVLRIIFKNRDNISINGIVERIKENKAPLPEKSDKIHDLLIGLSNEFEICGHDATHEFGNIQVQKKGCQASSEHSMQQDFPLQSLSQPSDPDSSIQQVIETQHQNDVDETDLDSIENEEVPDYSDTRELLPVLQSSNENNTKIKRNSVAKEYLVRFFCFCYYCYWFSATLITGVCGAATISYYQHFSTVSVTQINRPSIPFIRPFESALSIRLEEVSNPDIVPIQFYTLRQCFSQDSLLAVNINETLIVSFNSPTKSKSLTEWYFLRNTRISTTVTTKNIVPGYPNDHCIAFLVVFNDFDMFKNFLSTSSLNVYYLKLCIMNFRSQLIDINISKESYSYYYFGIYSDIPTEINVISVYFFGTYYQYDLSNLSFDCFLSSTKSLRCDFWPRSTFFFPEFMYCWFYTTN